MKGRGLFTLLAILTLALGVTGAALAAPPATQDVCPEGDGWSDHQDPESFGSVEGADNYCVKGGSSQSQGCTGYLEIGSFEYVSGFVGAEGYCGPSHWGYHIPEQQPTSTPTPEDPTATPTETLTPSETPTGTLTSTDTPTITQTPSQTGTATRTGMPDPTNTPRPKTGGGGPPETDTLSAIGIVSLAIAVFGSVLLTAFFAAVKKGRIRL
ncbi:MAG: Hemolysin-type calcium-binding region [Candidatus Woesebacteria bacterium GW2011_GWC2_47_16]|nr:MAG: Hemolysin-type calcium-binding region [Candidatus Woesebacteria bacterium GW2011_GWE1_45_18]KKU23173.1 MAG: Hemolysin-type calcium-binding region [Candidatus Woesebacteria bacterium GW2011_GWF1_46_13]KKU49223.1 MAG: Hemolysin-type calcium-binding region [Candidatus Woesebacteria bacterium GW2011_GWF2_46_8]KKU63481.1 MAG: Hemolysin-type calcium-binding region [Candidatus Woesebacteria bacterium GW2011_GWC2_47_16]OGM78421.1 MAG: hypothetical protein A2197_02930 [Candidatus Woesebacteria b